MKKAILVTAISLLSGFYAAYSIQQMVFVNLAPLSLQCVGVLLDPEKAYTIGNIDRDSNHELVIDFPQGKGIMPEILGRLFFNGAAGEFQLKTADKILDPGQDITSNPLLPFVRTVSSGRFQESTYFGPNKFIPEVDLRGGVRFNSPAGNLSSGMSVRIFDFGGNTYAVTQSEEIGTKYQIEANRSNTFSVICNQYIASSHQRIFYFENTADSTCDFTIEVLPGSPFSYSYTVTDGRNTVVSSGDSQRPLFQVGSYLFEISPTYNMRDLAFLVITLLLIGCFQIVFIKGVLRSPSPALRSIITFRALLNCVVFLSVPLFLLSLKYTNNRQWYLFLLIALNVSYVFNGPYFSSVLSKLRFPNPRMLFFGLIAVLIFLLPFVYFFAANENVLGVPVLHIQKAAVLGLVFLTGGQRFQRSSFSTWGRIALIVGYSVSLSLLTSDIGSFLYTCLALLLVELVNKSISPRLVSAYLLALIVGLSIFYNYTDDFFTDRKFYRIVAPYVSPDSEKLLRSTEADRETYSSLFLIQKALVAGSLPGMNSLQVPLPMRSTSFSDYAVFWSLAFGKGLFGMLFAITVLFILYELTFLLFISIRPVRINAGEAFVLPMSREAEFVRFLLAFALITFTYPVLSNLLLVPLTGQSFPCLSISILEIGFLVVFLYPVTAVFINRKHIERNTTIAYSYPDVRRHVRLAFSIFIFLFGFGCGLKLLATRDEPTAYAWPRGAESDQSTIPILPTGDTDSLILQARTIVGENTWRTIGKNKKAELRELASRYYTGQPYRFIRFESKYFQNTDEMVFSRMDLGSVFTDKRELVSGPVHPFGSVFRNWQRINGKERPVYTNDYYASIPTFSNSINKDLTAELSKELKDTLDTIGVSSNVGAIVVLDNRNGAIVANSSFPLNGNTNANETYYFIGSLKKVLLAYCALVIDPRYRYRVYNGKSFTEFLRWSDDVYAASLLRDIMIGHPAQFEAVLLQDFGIPLVSNARQDGYFDQKPDLAWFSMPLDRKNELYRYSIGQQKPYPLITAVEWFSRIAGRKKIRASYSISGVRLFEPIQISEEEWNSLQQALNSTLTGTAAIVRDSLDRNRISTSTLIAKTGTAESEHGNYNSSSSFVLASPDYTIGIMLKGRIPFNSQNLAAKNLAAKIVPILAKYKVL